MIWSLSHRFDPRAARLADRHYSRQKPGSPQFVRAGYNVVLITPAEDALWVSVYQPFVDHAWPGAWECALYRNENRAHPPAFRDVLLDIARSVARSEAA